VKILVPLAQFFPGGQTTHVLTLAKYLRRLGHDVTVIWTQPWGTMQVKAYDYRSTLARFGVEVLEARSGRAMALIQPFRWDVIHAHSTLDWPFALDASLRNNRPYVLTVHGLGCGAPKYRPYLERAARVIAVGSRVAASISELAPHVNIIENAIDTEVFRPETKNERPTVIFAGRLDPGRMPGLRALIAAVHDLQATMPVLFYVLSTKPRSATREAAGSGVIFTNWTDHPELYVNRAHVAVGSGRVIREGMAAGCACIVAGPRYGGLIIPEKLPGTGPHDFSGRSTALPGPTKALIARDLRRALAATTGAATSGAAGARDGPDLSTVMRDYALRHFNPWHFAKQTVRTYHGAQRTAGERMPPSSRRAT